MPTYEYKREDGTTFEVFQSMSEDSLNVCPTTGQPVKRMISGGTGLLFKGSGFYVTDYKNGKGKNGSSSEPKGDSSETKPSATDTKDSKPDTNKSSE